MKTAKVFRVTSLKTSSPHTFEFLIQPQIKLAPTKRENITHRVHTQRRALTQRNNEQTTLTAALDWTAHHYATTRHAFADAAYYATNTVDPDMDCTGNAEFDDCLGADNPEAHYASLGLTIMDEVEFFNTYCDC